jgi:hypothetical protein
MPSCFICERTSTTPPDLGDSAAREADDEDLVVGDGFAGWREAPVLALVCPGKASPLPAPQVRAEPVHLAGQRHQAYGWSNRSRTRSTGQARSSGE